MRSQAHRIAAMQLPIKRALAFSMDLILEEYSLADRPACLELFSTNVGIYWQDCERTDFEHFLDQEVGEHLSEARYFIARLGSQVLGSAGYAKTSTAVWIEWVMVHKEHHGKGLGSTLLSFNLDHISKTFCGIAVQLCTSPLTNGFYEKYGFKSESVELGGYRQSGLDKIKMLYVVDNANN